MARGGPPVEGLTVFRFKHAKAMLFCRTESHGMPWNPGEIPFLTTVGNNKSASQSPALVRRLRPSRRDRKASRPAGLFHAHEVEDPAKNVPREATGQEREKTSEVNRPESES